MRDKHFIILAVGFCFTLFFELGSPFLYRDWFLGADIIYPNSVKEWGDRAGTYAISLEQYLHDIAEHLHVIALYFYIFINSKEKAIFKILLIFFCFSLLNYLYNYHMPLILGFDTNYAIIVFMIVVLISKGKNWWK